MKYTHLFDSTQEQIQDYISNYLEPWVDFDEQGLKVHYNKSFENQYLTFECLSAGTITITASNDLVSKTISYSTDNGNTWADLATSTTEQSLGTFAIGDKVLIKGNNNSYSNGSYSNKFGGTAQVKVYGNIMSLIYGDNFIGQTTFPSGSSYNFSLLFYNYTNLIDVSNLILPAITLTNGCYSNMFVGSTSFIKAPELPATTLSNFCYASMFSGCTSLTLAPELPATTLVEYCYGEMFYNCTNLNYIKCLATNISANNCTTNWVKNVAATGIFITGDNPPAWTIGNNGIPTGWVARTESQLKEVKHYELEALDNKIDNSRLKYVETSGQEPVYLTVDQISDSDSIAWGQKEDGWTADVIPAIATTSTLGSIKASLVEPVIGQDHTPEDIGLVDGIVLITDPNSEYYGKLYVAGSILYSKYTGYDAILDLSITSYDSLTEECTYSGRFIYNPNGLSITDAINQAMSGQSEIGMFVHFKGNILQQITKKFPRNWQEQLSYVVGDEFRIYNPVLPFIDLTLTPATSPYIEIYSPGGTNLLQAQYIKLHLMQNFLVE